MKKGRMITSVEMLGMVNKEKQSGKSYGEIVETLAKKGLDESTVEYYYSVLK